MNYLRKNLESLYKALEKKYPDINKSIFAKILKTNRVTLYRYWVNGEEPKNVTTTWLQKIANAIYKELGIIIDPHSLIERDLSEILLIDEKHKVDKDEYEPKYDDLAFEIRYLRKAKHLTYKTIARQSRKLYPNDKSKQISDVYILKIEQGRARNVSPKKLATLAEILDVPVEKFLRYYGLLPKVITIKENKIIININPDYLKRNGSREDIKRRIINMLDAAFPGIINE